MCVARRTEAALQPLVEEADHLILAARIQPEGQRAATLGGNLVERW